MPIPAGGMPFPLEPLDVRVDLQINGTWTDVTADTLVRDGITINRGRADEASRADAQTCLLTLKNRDGKYSPRNPMSPYYGLLGRNTPLRVGVGAPPVSATSDTTVASTSLVAPSVVAERTGTLFVTWGAAPVGNIAVPAGYAAGTERDGTLSTWGAARKSDAIAPGPTGTITATHSVSATGQACATVAVPGVVSSAAGYSTLATGGGLATLTFSSAPGDYLLVVNGFSSDPEDNMVRAPVERPAQSPGWVLLSDSGPSTGPRMKVWCRRIEKAKTSASLYFTGDDVTASDNYARAWVITGAEEYFPRFTGEVPAWPARWDASGVDVHVPITASGIKRRLGQGASPLLSALRRELATTPNVIAYWPMEDGASATSFGAVVGGSRMTFLGAPVLATDDRFQCADALPTFNAAGAIGSVRYSATGSWVVGALTSAPTGLTDQATLFTIKATGTVATWTVRYDVTYDGFRVQGHDANGALIEDLTYGSWTFPPLSPTMFMYFKVYPSGSNVHYRLGRVGIVDGVESPTTQEAGASIGPGAVGAVTSFKLGGGTVPLNQDVTFGHAVAANSSSALFSAAVYSALTAWVGETPQARYDRLAMEENMVVGYQAFAIQRKMGVQRPGTLLALLEQAEDTDGGTITEPRGFLGFQFRPRSSRYNQATSLTLDYLTSGHIAPPLEPVDDDQATRNDLTETRIGGGFSRAELLVGPLSTQPPPLGVGRYDVDYQLSLPRDADAEDEAAWRLHLGTWDEARWPQVGLDLAAAPSLINAVQALDVGDLVRLTSLPAWVAPGAVDLIVEGYTETLTPFSWAWTGNFSPAGPYRVGTYSAESRYSPDSAMLNGAITSTATTASVTTTGPAWITTASHPSEFPFDVIVGGERMTVTAISGATSPQTFTVTRSVDGVAKAHVTGTVVALHRPARYAL